MSKTIEKGIIASPGIRIGKAYVYHGDTILIQKYTIREEDVTFEISRLESAIEKTKAELKSIQEQIAENLSRDMADIFTSHIMVLEDPLLEEKYRKTIIEHRRNAEWAINDISLELINSLSSIKDDYLRDRIIDISDISKRIISNLQKTETSSLQDITEEVIVFAQDLTPSETALMNKERILAFVTDRGGRTSHTAIMARALEIPAIVGTINATSMVKDGDTVIVDAIHGRIIIGPSREEISEYRRYEEEFEELELELAKLTTLPSKTLDSEDIFIYGNIEIPDEMKIIKDHGAQGIGLFRSEFLFMDQSLPDEEKQFQEYRRVVEYFKPLPVTIRTIDVGADKVYAYTNHYKERNPFLGCRAIRFSLENEDLFRIQLRAILRASAFGTLKLMFPMITAIEEFKRAKNITLEIMEDLRREKIAFDEKIKIGLMIEVPSAVVYADVLAKYADFFSVGTNDLVQYLLAVDRISEKIAYLYNPLNLSVLRFLKQVADTARNNSTQLSICGEMAGEPQYTMVLLGLGFRHLSMSPVYMHQVKKIIRSVSISECEELVQSLMALEETEDIENLVRKKFKEKFEHSQ
ncbi:MAG TPA: phosphoenolpyruvate--protein phosphotransferase [Spirochaetota bacterium]|nr:phosphoenolpyruvate--protein phosphotransferase [Spirochaetota bacterium]HPC40837.1 phosphoenolpyruvate--protein phosphotransferase [Spirochaetota bacterium]HQF07773.1 phosphoenolpyruvate--protein phosphotransferase [Spirochaetota bacterium]HQH96826.1 phosphoenolpyruvate--protein phosphotransferase [Spirochaetota bacterium]HQJ70667.1 phosphoenolpyruvate--protein phosphotransferase [Spirochaetota bacterium]